MTALEIEIERFQKEHYPRQDIADRLRKLGEEVGELAEAVARGNRRSIIEESADCAIVLAGITNSVHASLAAAMTDKLEVLWERKEWEKTRK